MAPMTPEEVDVFKIPHSRMKELVFKYCDMMQTTNFSDVYHLNSLLENLIKTFHEFIAHEQIENKYIMKKLKNKLRSLSIQNTAVCNCHKDNQLTDMLSLIEDGYKCTKKSEMDRKNFGLKLRHALEDFTRTFLPHMAEEEEVFQPLLMEHFTFDELKQIKAAVLEQHFKVEAEEEKLIADSKSDKQKSVKVVKEQKNQPTTGITTVPDELLLKMFSYLNPKELSRVSQVCKRWNNLAYDPTLWKDLYPVSWANGNWNATQGVYDEESQNLEEKLTGKLYDEDADIDESDDWDAEAIEIQKQSRMLTHMCKYLLPRVGPSIQKCDLAYSKGITNGTLYKILSLCPNLEFLDLTQTRVSDLGFKGLEKEGCGQNLRHLDLTGCLYITDLTLRRVSHAINTLPCHMENMDENLNGKVGHKDEGNTIKQNQSNEQDGVPSNMEVRQIEDRSCDSSWCDCPQTPVSDTNHCRHGGESCNCNKECSKDYRETCRHGDDSCSDRLDNHKQDCDSCNHGEYNCRYSVESYKHSKEMCNHVDDICKQREVICRHGVENYRHSKENCKYCGKSCSNCRESCRNSRETSHDDRSFNEMSRKNCVDKAKPGSGVCNDCDKKCDCDHKLARGFMFNNGCDNDVMNQHKGRQPDINPKILSTEGGTGRVDNQDNDPTRGCQSSCKGCKSATSDKHGSTIFDEYVDEDVNDTSQMKAEGQDSPTDNDTAELSADLSVDDPPFGDPVVEPGTVEIGTQLSKEIHIETVPVILTEPQIEPEMKDEYADNQTPSRDVEKHNQINLTSPAITSVVQTQLDDTDVLINVTEGLIIELTLKCDEDPVKKPDTVTDEVMHDDIGSDTKRGRCLEYLSLSGCYQITDCGLQYLTDDGGLPYLRYLDLSGCQDLSGEAVSDLVSTATKLDPCNLFYCDNILDGPYAEVASGCQNLQCSSRMCCRCAE